MAVLGREDRICEKAQGLGWSDVIKCRDPLLCVLPVVPQYPAPHRIEHVSELLLQILGREGGVREVSQGTKAFMLTNNFVLSTHVPC